MSNETKQEHKPIPELILSEAKKHAIGEATHVTVAMSLFVEHSFIQGAMYGSQNNPYKTACESINKNNPMAVAENLPALIRQAEMLVDIMEECGYLKKEGALSQLLTKIQSK